MAPSLSSFKENLPQQASLLGLAVEIRSEILKYLVGSVILHVSSNRTRRPAKTVQDWLPTYSYFVCSDVNAEEAMKRNKTAPSRRRTLGGRICEYKVSNVQWEVFKYERDDRIARRYFHMAIARANRQLYEESSWAFLEYNTFSFCEPVAWQQFRDDHTAAQLNHMRAIELFTMTPELDTEKGHGEGDPYARTAQDCCWRFDNVGILKNVTKIMLGLRRPHRTYNGMARQTVETIEQALDWAFGDLSGLKRLKEAEAFVILEPLRTALGAPVDEQETEQITSRLSVLTSSLEAKLLAFHPQNIASSTRQGETQH